MAADLATSSIGPFLIVFREGLEAGLVATIIFAYLRKIERGDLCKWGYLGVFLSILASFGLGYLLYGAYIGFAESFVEIFEPSAGLAAAVVLSYVILWMTRNARKIRGEMEQRIDVAVTSGNVAAISLAAFTSVGREGLETVLFLAPFIGENLIGVLAGAFFGVVSIVILLFLLARRVYRARLSSVFKYTSLLLTVLAAGILYHTANELTEMPSV